MKIAFISRWLYDENKRHGAEGGGEQQRVAAYQKLGHEIVVLSQSPDATVLEERSVEGIRVILTPRWTRAGILLGLLDKLAKPFTRHRKVFTDLWHLHLFLKRYGPFDCIEAQCEEPDGLIVALLSLFSRLPPWSVQIFALRYHFENARPIFEQRTVLGFVFSRATLVKANSYLVAEHLSSHYGCGREKIAIVPHNLTSQFLDSTAGLAGPADTHSSTRKILCLAALNEKKGIRFFVEAASLLNARRSDLHFISVGGSTASGSYAGEVQRLSSHLGLETVFTWAGELRGELLRQEISEASVIVIPSLLDEWNRVAVEAVALGRPVVISEDCGAAPWIARTRCGIVVPSANSKALADAIESVLANPAYQAATSEGGRKIREELSPESVAKLTAELMQKYLPTSSASLNVT